MSRLEGLARRWRGERLRTAALDGAARLACAALAGLVALASADQLFSLPQGARWALLAAGLAALAGGLWKLIAAPWRGFSWRDVMRAATARYPFAAESLPAAWELREASGPYTSAALRLEHLARTEDLLRRVPDEPLFSFAPARATRLAAACAAAAALALPWLWRSPAWERSLAPWRDVPLERYVRIAPGTTDVAWGKPAALEARWDSGGPLERGPARVTLWLRGEAGWRRARWDREAPGSASFTAEEVVSPLAYRLSWRDLESLTYRLTPVAAPQLESLRARVQGADQGVSALDASRPLSVLRGSWVEVIGKPNQTLAHAGLRLSTLPGEIALKPSPGGEVSASFQVREDAVLRLDLETPDGRRDPDPSSYPIRAVADEPPKVELISPLQPIQVSPEDSLPVSFSARDDGGVASVSLLVKPATGPEREVPVARFSSPRKEYLGDYTWDLSSLPLGKARFRLKALDNAVPAQAGYSQPGELELVDFASAHKRMEERWLKAEESLKDLSEREGALRDKLASPDQKASQEELDALKKAWRRAAEDMNALSNAMQEDAYANPGMAEASKRAAEDVARAEKSEVPSALDAARGQDRTQARRAHARLAQQAEAARRLLAEGRKVQGLQDLFTGAGRMSQASSQLESDLENAAARKSISRQDKERLDAALSKLAEQMRSLQNALDRLPKAESAAEADGRKAVDLPIESARRGADQLARALARGDYAAAADIARKLSDDLQRIERALGSAAQSSPAASSSRRQSKELQQLQSAWSEALDAQTKAVEGARRLGEGQVRRKLDAEKELIARLAREQAVVVSSAAARGASFRPEALSWMRQALSEFQSGKVSRAPDLLRATATRLRQPGVDGRVNSNDEPIAASEEAILRELEAGAARGGSSTPEERDAAAKGQADARGKARELQTRLESFADQGGTLPGGALPKIEQAQGEQGRAESDLGKGEAGSGLKHAQGALDLLSQGAEQMGQAAGAEGSMESGLGRPFQRPGTVIRIMRGGGGVGQGAELGFVPLPSSKDYAPPRALREELEKSLREPRPASYDKVIKEYFKRVAQ